MEMTEAGDAKTTCRPSQRIVAHCSIFNSKLFPLVSLQPFVQEHRTTDKSHPVCACHFRSLLCPGFLCDVHLVTGLLPCTSTFTLDRTPSRSFTHSLVPQNSLSLTKTALSNFRVHRIAITENTFV